MIILVDILRTIENRDEFCEPRQSDVLKFATTASVVQLSNHTYITCNTISRLYFIKNKFYCLYQPTKLIYGPCIVAVYHIDNYIKEGRNLHFHLLKLSTKSTRYPGNLGVSVFEDDR